MLNPGSGVDGSIHARRNRAEHIVRDRVGDLHDVYVHRSSWRRDPHRPEAFVAIIARDSAARETARIALGDISGLSEDAWRSDWVALSLGDWMINIFPERTG